MKIEIIILIALVIVPFVSRSQSISGYVKGEDGVELIGAHVLWQGSESGTITDENGFFELERIETTNTLHVYYLGYESMKQTVDAQASNISIILKEEFNELEAVTITAGTFEASDKSKSATLTSLDIVTTAGAQGDITNALQSLPGTTTVGESGRLFVRGGESRESQVYIDGMLVPEFYTTSAPNQAVRGRFNPFMFEGTTFNTGGYSAEYGQALSSVLLLDTKGVPEEDQLDVGLMSVGLDLNATKRWDNGAVSVNANYINLGPYMGLIPQNIDWNKEPEAYNTSISFRQKTSDQGLLRAYSTFGQSNLIQYYSSGLNGDDSELLNVDIKNHFSTASWKSIIGEKWSLNAGLSYTHNEDDVYSPTLVENKTHRASFSKLTAKYYALPKLTLHAGVDWNHTNYNYGIETEENYHFRSKITENISSGFGEAQYYFTNKFVLKAGLRIERSDYLEDTRWSPRLSMAYKSGANSQINLAYGTYYQLPDFDHLIYSDQFTQEKAEHLILNYQYSKNRRLIRLETYYKKYDQLAKQEGVSWSNSGDGYAQGIDLFYKDQRTIKNGQFWVSYSYLDSKRNYLNYPHEAIPTYVSKHKVSVVYKHMFNSIRSFPSVTLTYSSPRVYNNPNLETFNGQKMSAYKSVNLSWSYLFRYNVIFYASVTNLFNFDRDFGYRYSSIPNTEGIYEGVKIEPAANQFFFIGCFLTFTKSGTENQLDKLN